jgi:hypothetical protein
MGDTFKVFVWDALVQIAIQRLFKAIPWLGFGPVGVVVSWVAGMLAEQLYDAAKLVIDLKTVAFVNEVHRKAYENASIKLAVLAHDKGIDSDEFKVARDEHKKALHQFVLFNV